MDKNIVITIARQYGSGGRTIAQMLSERLGIHYYDKELLRLASEDSGINEDLFRNADEKIKNTKLFKILLPWRTCSIIRQRSSRSWQSRTNPVLLLADVQNMY